MSGIRAIERAVARGFMGRLARDVRGNTLAIMAAALIPLAGMVGGGIDISRMYITKTRLQHACDAGALAGRKAMGGGNWGTDDNAVAQQFFKANFKPGSYGAGTATPVFTESAGKVTGTVSTALPMTVMKIFKKYSETLTVTCDADMRLPNTDIMFVLDTTGSMKCDSNGNNCNNGSGSKMAGLKVAVKCFYEIVARLNTDVNCDAGVPSGGTGNQTQIRFGFVPYSTNVNVGKLLPNSYMPDSVEYQTRVANWTIPSPVTTTNGPYWQTYTDSISQDNCLKYMKNQSFSGFTPTPLNSGGPAPTPTVVTSFSDDGVATAGGTGEWGWTGAGDTSGTSRSCRRSRTDVTTTYPTFKDWDYKPSQIDISGLKAGESNWNNSITTQTGNNGTNATITWDGCIEERKTVQATSYSPIPSGARDLDIDSPPIPGNAETQWKPALPRLVYQRTTGNGTRTRNAVTQSNSNFSTIASYYFCPSPAKKLQPWPDPVAFDNYVNDLVPDGNTYHDIGMIWGARLMSPTGIFRSENEFTLPTQYTQGGADIERHMIFMTDGDAVSQACDYTAYGTAFWDRFTTDDVGTSAECPGIDGGRPSLNTQVNLRLAALCAAVKNKNITLWVISFGNGSNTDTESRLATCASPDRFFTARDSAALQRTFASIANQISQLRLTR
ncbi:TadE/TadG family type IV pilus assembly protein [Sphingomonas sp.]|uniref:TadE/TadG family type IV pilus assembly protein n=1 Tax=Sphingomonas sp. TaxID=28214 RepID=UPI003D6CECD8